MLGTAHHTENMKQTIIICQEINILTGRQYFLLAAVKRRKLSWFGHVYRHDKLPKVIRQGTVEGSRRSGWATSSDGLAGRCRRIAADASAGLRRPGVTGIRWLGY